MKVDIGFWDSQGNYIPDIQEVSEVEMDKEIIIDGVDVAGCRYILLDRTCYYEFSNDYVPTPCSLDPDCQYKQLKRLEQENAELKAENAELREKLKGYKNGIKKV